MKKIILLLGVLLLLPGSVRAVDNYQIDCHSEGVCPVGCPVCPGQCPPCPSPPAGGKPLFSVTDMKPGFYFYKKLTVANTRSEECQLYFSASNKNDPANLAGVLKVWVNRNGVEKYTGKIEDIFNSPGAIFLDTLSAQTTAVFDWKMAMDKEAGNIYQNRTLKFNLGLIFQCITPERTPTLAPPIPTRFQIPTLRPRTTPTPIPIPNPINNCLSVLLQRPFSLANVVRCVLGRQ